MREGQRRKEIRGKKRTGVNRHQGFSYTVDISELLAICPKCRLNKMKT